MLIGLRDPSSGSNGVPKSRAHTRPPAGTLFLAPHFGEAPILLAIRRTKDRGRSPRLYLSQMPPVGRSYLGVNGKLRRLSACSCSTNNNEQGGKPLSRDLPRFRRTAAPIVERRRHHHQTGPADSPVRLPRRVGGLARRAARDVRGAVAQVCQEGLGHRERNLRSSRRSRPLLRLDRRPGAQTRRGLLAAAVHAA